MANPGLAAPKNGDGDDRRPSFGSVLRISPHSWVSFSSSSKVSPFLGIHFDHGFVFLSGGVSLISLNNASK